MPRARSDATRSPRAGSPPPSAGGADGDAAPPAPDPVVETAAGRACPHCGAAMIAHDAPVGAPKHAAWHCNACGGCFVHRGSAWVVRAGHPPPAGWTGGVLAEAEP